MQPRLVHSSDWPSAPGAPAAFIPSFALEAALPPAPPRPPAPAPRAPAQPAEPQFTYGLHGIARLLGVESRSEGWKKSYVADLIAAEGFPPPLPLRVKGVLTREIHPRKSQWPALAVRAWFLAQSPAQAVARVEDAAALEAEAAAAARMDDSLDRLFPGDAA